MTSRGIEPLLDPDFDQPHWSELMIKIGDHELDDHHATIACSALLFYRDAIERAGQTPAPDVARIIDRLCEDATEELERLMQPRH